MKKILTVVFATLIAISTTSAQLSKEQLDKVDKLVASWNKANSPGGVVGIMGNGKLLFVKPFGMASLDYDVLNTDSTIFNIGSVSKQFTAMGIVKLHLDKKLSIDDDIRKYLPDLPELDHKITIRHLLHHTSGLRSIHSILALAGWRNGDPRTNEDLFEIMKNQKDLNHAPSDEYLYSNTNYIFMAMIIEAITEESFEHWMKENIFLPLGLTKTYVENTATRVVKGNATSYRQQKDKSYNRAVEYWDYTGSGNVHTTANDLLIWLNNFSSTTNGWGKAFDMLQTTDTLNNGQYLNYAFGIEIDSLNGTKRISHGGGVGGFRSFSSIFPSHSISIVVLTNYSSSNPFGKSNAITNIIFPQLTEETNNKEKTFEGFSILPNDDLKKYEGDYWFDYWNSYRKIQSRNDTLWYCRSNGKESLLQYIGNDEFIIMPKAMWKVKFMMQKDSVESMIVESSRYTNDFVPFTPVEFTASYLSGFLGTYYSPELDTYYKLSINNDTIYAHHPRHGHIKLEAVELKDKFTGEEPLKSVIFSRDSKNNILGMRVSNGRVKNLWLEKLE